MASMYSNPNGFPMADGKNLHMDIGFGEIANRIVTVGPANRADKIAAFLDASPAPTKMTSGRGFYIINGAYQGVSVSIVAIGIGPSMMDLFVRETRAVTHGPLVICRFGTCGGIAAEAFPGSIVVASGGSGYVARNPDAFVHLYEERAATSISSSSATAPSSSSSSASVTVASSVEEVAAEAAYRIAKVAPADAALSSLVKSSLDKYVGEESILTGINVTAESFYSSQGRIDDRFEDQNQDLFDALHTAYGQDAKTMEMESFTLLHLARCCSSPILASAAAIVVANRKNSAVIEGAVLERAETMGGKAVLEAVATLAL